MKTLIKNGTVLTMDRGKTVYSNGYVLFDEEKIYAVGSCEDLQEETKVPVNGHLEQADILVDGQQGILMPGMINVHCHIPMMPFRSLGDDCPDRLRRFLFPLELKAMTPQLVYTATEYGVAELLLAGVTSVLDMYYFEEEVAKACENMGIRAWVGETVIGQETCDSKEPYGGLKLCRKLLKDWSGHSRIHPFVAPHATNTNSSQMLKAAWDLAQEFDALYSLHVSEMDYEMDYFRETYGKTPIEFLYDLGVLGPGTIGAHCIHATEKDIFLLSETDTKVAHCVVANTKSGKGICPVRDMRKQGVTVGIGSDGPSSGNTLDLFTQLRMAACCQKTKYHDRSLFPTEEMVELATMGGAAVLGAENQIGSLQAGKKADLVLLDTSAVNMFPLYDPYSAIVYSANASNVHSVWVDGKRLVDNHRLTLQKLENLRHSLEGEMKDFVAAYTIADDSVTGEP